MMQYMVDAVLSVCGTWCVLYMVCAVLDVNSELLNEQIARDDLTLWLGDKGGEDERERKEK